MYLDSNSSETRKYRNRTDGTLCRFQQHYIDSEK